MKKSFIFTIISLLIFLNFNLLNSSITFAQNLESFTELEDIEKIEVGSIIFDLDTNNIISSNGEILDFNVENEEFLTITRANEVIIYVPKKIKKQGYVNVNGLKKHVANVDKNMKRLELISHLASLLVVNYPIVAVGNSTIFAATYIVDKIPLNKKKTAIRNKQSLYWVEVYANGSSGASIQVMNTFSSKPVRYVYRN